jgi:hypothetical protein
METLVKLTANEIEALRNLQQQGGGVLTTSVPDKNDKDPVFGTVEPGIPVYRKLERKGLVFFTEEEPIDDPDGPLDGFVFTNEIYITDEGLAVLQSQ